MAAPYNGGDDHYSASNHVGGSGNITNITAAEISVIVVTIVGVLGALVLVFYCRILRARRDIDMEHKAGQPQGDAIELGGQKRVSGGSCDTAVGNSNGKPESSSHCHPEFDKQQKPPLRHYIHWKSPHKETLPHRQQNGSQDDGLTVPSPAYFV
ncbi:hypothetical protein QBC44DRAFT_377328 [Cladorrhinum sp. PSN332]|nr:hypothetical protein QBC44DRAFT_377328 [Cladorrhinum sp. PSN332]